MNATDWWYSQPLSREDQIAGLSLLSIGTIGIFLYLFLAYILFKYSDELTGFRYLFSESIVGCLVLLEYGTWPGLTVLLKSQIVPQNMRCFVQAYIDWVWFSMCYHYSVIAWSRFCAIRFPVFFRLQTKLLSRLICSLCYIAALIQTVINQQLPFYVLFYYEPSAYGLVAVDFEKYRKEGHAKYFMIYNGIALLCPLLLYSVTIYCMMRQKHEIHATADLTTFGHQNKLKVEMSLIVPCTLNTIVFLIGQVVLTIGWDAGKWFGWSVLVLFCLQALANPVLLLVFSSAIRQKVATCLRVSKGSRKVYSAANRIPPSNHRPSHDHETGSPKGVLIHNRALVSRLSTSIVPVG